MVIRESEDAADISNQFCEYGGDTSLAVRRAAQDGNADAVLKLARGGADVNGAAAIITASLAGDAAIVKVLLDHGANVGMTRKIDGYSALLIAAEKGFADVCQLLINHGANVNKETLCGDTPLMCAAKNGHEEVVQILTERGATVDQTAQTHDCTALMLAAEFGHTNVMEALLERGALVDKPKKNRETPLIMAARNGHLPAIRLLVEFSADVNASSVDGYTALMYAAAQGHECIVEYLLENGADVNSANGFGYTALCFCSSKPNCIYSAERLLMHGANLGHTSRTGNSPLIGVVTKDQLHTTRLFVQHCADVNYKHSREGYTALTRAQRWGRNEIANYLMSLPIDLSSL